MRDHDDLQNPVPEDELRYRLVAASHRHATAPAPDGADRAARTATTRRAVRVTGVAALAAAVLVGAPAAVVALTQADDAGIVTPVVSPPSVAPTSEPTPTDSPSETATGEPTAPEPTATVQPTDGTDQSSPPASPTVGDGLPGEPVPDGWPLPDAGEVLSVVGVAEDDTLNVRELPGADQPILSTIPNRGSAVALGRGRVVAGTTWLEVEHTNGGDVGWVSSRFVTRGLGGVVDLTQQVVDSVGEVPSAPTVAELGRIVTDAIAPGDEVEPRVVAVRSPVTVPAPDVTYDVIGVADDAILGYRARITGELSPDGQSVVLTSVEALPMCARGVTDDGLCL